MFGGFEDFLGGMGGGGRPGSQGPIDNKGLYQALGVDSNCSPKELKKAWRKAALEHHPDKGGDIEQFQKAQKAYEVLSNPEKRELYDQYGEEAVNGDGSGGGGGDMNDILRSFFGGGGGGGRGARRGPPRGKDTGARFPCTLAECYSGASKQVPWSRREICSLCDGLGGPPEAKKDCHTCDGRGFVIQTIRMGPMIQQQQAHCSSCSGKGYFMKNSMKCQPCSGKGLRQIEKVIDFGIIPGMADEDKIMVESEGGDKLSADMIAGDVYVVLQVQDHDVFTREGDNLMCTKHISLLESLTGFQFDIVHLDGKVMRVTSNDGEVVAPDSIKMVPGKGMPRHDNPQFFGDLFIQFVVDFPEHVHVEKREYDLLKGLLGVGGSPHPRFEGGSGSGQEVEDVIFMDARPGSSRDGHGHGQDGHEEHDQSGGVQCQTQ